MAERTTKFRSGRAHQWIRGNVLGLVAIFLALNGTAVAVQVAEDGKGNKAASAKKKKPKAKPGPPGPQGPAGPQGPQGPAGSADTGPQILAKLAPVDGSGSGLDADLLDGMSSAAFIASGQAAGGNLAGTYPNPTLNVTGGPCTNGQEISHDGDATLNCSAGVYSDASNNVAAGPTAFPALSIGTANSALGSGALQANSSGERNVAIGRQALLSNLSGDENTAVGMGALDANVHSDSNTAIGHEALGSAVSGSRNVAVGQRALRDLTSGGFNIAIGGLALANVEATAGNIAIGDAALNNTTGGGNISIGDLSGQAITNTNNNILLDHAGVLNDSGTLRIGDSLDRAFIDGIRGTTTGAMDAIPVVIDTAGQLGTTSSSRSVKRGIEQLDSTGSLMKLKPVSFYYREGPAELHYGLLAEQVAKVLPELAVYGEDGLPETVQYQELPALLLATVQRQQRQINRLTRLVKDD